MHRRVRTFPMKSLTLSCQSHGGMGLRLLKRLLTQHKDKYVLAFGNTVLWPADDHLA